MRHGTFRTLTWVDRVNEFTVFVTEHLRGHEIVSDVFLFDIDAHGMCV